MNNQLNKLYLFKLKLKKIPRIIREVLAIFVSRFSPVSINNYIKSLEKIKDFKGPMVLHFSTSGYGGGAARAAVSIHSGLLNAGYKSITVVYKKRKNGNDLILRGFKVNFFRWMMSLYQNRKSIRAARILTKSKGILYSNQVVSIIKLQKIIDVINPDIVHLHWINYDLLSIEDIGKINVPVVWTLHDMWPFCGAEHVSFTSEYKSGYKKTPETAPDKLAWLRKKSAYASLNLNIVGVSRWMTECASQSTLFKKVPHSTISNIINFDSFFPANKNDARQRLNLPENISLIVFGSDYQGFVKGYDMVDDLLSQWDDPENCALVVFGRSPVIRLNNSLKIYNLGYIDDNAKLTDIYSAGDVTIIPSRLESFCLMAAESIACGTPVVSFDTSGLKDIVENGKNGYRVECFSIEKFGQAVGKVLKEQAKDKYKPSVLHKNIRKKFDKNVIVKQYAKLYTSIAKKTGSKH